MRTGLEPFQTNAIINFACGSHPFATIRYCDDLAQMERDFDDQMIVVAWEHRMSDDDLDRLEANARRLSLTDSLRLILEAREGKERLRQLMQKRGLR